MPGSSWWLRSLVVHPQSRRLIAVHRWPGTCEHTHQRCMRVKVMSSEHSCPYKLVPIQLSGILSGAAWTQCMTAKMHAQIETLQCNRKKA